MHNDDTTYRAEVVSAKYEHAEDGRDIARVVLRLLDPAAQGVEAEWFGFFDSKSIRRTIRTLRVLGFDPCTLDEIGGLGTIVLVTLLAEVDRYGDLRVYVTNVGPQGDGVFGRRAPLAAHERAALVEVIRTVSGGRYGK